MALKINIDTGALASAFKELALEVEQDLNAGVQSLALQAHAKVAEMARDELKTSRQQLTDNLGFEEIAPGVWSVSIDEKAFWIEEGINANTDMKPGLLKNPDGTSKEGYKYKVIPFHYDKAPSSTPPATQNLVNLIKQHLKDNKVPFKKIEKNDNGSPKLGKLHEFNIKSAIPGKGNTPALQGLHIYQTLNKKGKVQRDILTFRTVSENPSNAHKWIHPGTEAKHFLDKASEWAINEWENRILPEVMNKWKA